MLDIEFCIAFYFLSDGYLQYNMLTSGKNYGFIKLGVCSTFFFYLAVNKLIIDKTQNTFYLIPEHTGFIKYSLNQLD